MRNQRLRELRIYRHRVRRHGKWRKEFNTFYPRSSNWLLRTAMLIRLSEEREIIDAIRGTPQWLPGNLRNETFFLKLFHNLPSVAGIMATMKRGQFPNAQT